MLTTEAFLIVVRYLIASAGGAMVQRGYLASGPGSDVINATAQIAVGGIVFLAPLAWGLWRSRRAAKIADVAAMPDVSTIHMDPALAASMKAQGVPNVIATPPAAP